MTEDEQKEIFSRNLLKYVKDSGKTQLEIATDIGVSPQTFNTWINGKALPRMGKVQTLADYFGIGKTDLLDAKNIHIKKSRDITDHEYALILAYRKAPEYQKMAICDMLHVKGDDAESSSSRKGA